MPFRTDHFVDYMKPLVQKGSKPLVLYTSSGPQDEVHHPGRAKGMKEHCDQVGVTCFLYGSEQSGLPEFPRERQ